MEFPHADDLQSMMSKAASRMEENEIMLVTQIAEAALNNAAIRINRALARETDFVSPSDGEMEGMQVAVTSESAEYLKIHWEVINNNHLPARITRAVYRYIESELEARGYKVIHNDHYKEMTEKPLFVCFLETFAASNEERSIEIARLVFPTFSDGQRIWTV